MLLGVVRKLFKVVRHKVNFILRNSTMVSVCVRLLFIR